MVYILLGKGFEETEAIAPGDVLRRAQIPMQYVGIGGRIVEGAHGISVQADITADQMELSQMDMLVLPGGLGGVESIEGSDHLRIGARQVCGGHLRGPDDFGEAGTAGRTARGVLPRL